MICQFCHGQRLIRVRGGVQPCEECGGKGEIHCCEGLQSQPEGAWAEPLVKVPDWRRLQTDAPMGGAKKAKAP